jgi:hypothetical protein
MIRMTGEQCYRPMSYRVLYVLVYTSRALIYVSIC